MNRCHTEAGDGRMAGGQISAAASAAHTAKTTASVPTRQAHAERAAARDAAVRARRDLGWDDIGRSAPRERLEAAEGLALDQLGLAPVGPDRHLADEGDAVEHALDVEVVHVLRPEVRGGPVVPERHAARLPMEANRVLGPGEVLEEEVEQAAALFGVQADDPADEPG